jgi:hypothetical protein
MLLEIRKVQVWRGEIDNLLGAAAALLERLAPAGVDLQFIFTRPHPKKPEAGLIFLAPITGKEQIRTALDAGLAPALDVAMLYLQGPNRPGIGYEIMSQLAVAGIPMQGMSTSAAGPCFGAYLAFDNADDASLAVQVLATLDL